MAFSPTWHREATAPGLHHIVLVYEKAEDLVFCPTHRDRPFRGGGDDDGHGATTAAGAMSYLNPGFMRSFAIASPGVSPF